MLLSLLAQKDQDSLVLKEVFHCCFTQAESPQQYCPTLLGAKQRDRELGSGTDMGRTVGTGEGEKTAQFTVWLYPLSSG